MKRIIDLRRRHKVFGRGAFELVDAANPRVFAYLRRLPDQQVLVVANLSRFAQPAALDLPAFKGWTPVEMFGHTRFPPLAEGRYQLALGPHNFYWFRLER